MVVVVLEQALRLLQLLELLILAVVVVVVLELLLTEVQVMLDPQVVQEL
jgi:hypothetical protein